MHPNLTHLPVPLYPPLQHPRKKKKNLIVEVVVCHMSHSVPFCPHFFACKCLLERVIVLVGGLWLLLHYQHWNLTETPFRYPVVALCHGDPAVLDQPNWPFHEAQPLADDKDFGVAQFRTLDLDLGGS